MCLTFPTISGNIHTLTDTFITKLVNSRENCLYAKDSLHQIHKFANIFMIKLWILDKEGEAGSSLLSNNNCSVEVD